MHHPEGSFMATLQLVPSSVVLLTKETMAPDPRDTTRTVPTGVLCDLDGNPLPAGTPGIPSYLDSLTGKRYARIATVLPSNGDPASKAKLAAIMERKPVSYSAGNLSGWYVPSPDFTINGIDGKKPASSAPASSAAAAASDAPANLPAPTASVQLPK
jgi:hypothetical protein